LQLDASPVSVAYWRGHITLAEARELLRIDFILASLVSASAVARRGE
jgi:hypothetical protein